MKDYGDISSLVPEVERFEALDAIPSVKHSFLLRAPGIDVCMDRQAALVNLRQYYRSGISGLGYGLEDTAAAEQVHGKAVERVERVLGFDAPVADADALVTDRPGILLAILVADCCAVFLADKKGRGVALVHSGRKGSGMGIVTRAILSMREMGISPDDLVAVLSPCIRPPAYEEDFAAIIRKDCLRAGIPEAQVHDEGICTASNPGRYYSYRREGGRTGRMLALLGLSP
ncbi:MAG: polyphenol oxidase family protein [Verrucomicrobiaceae bacterium]|nr:polyphenol oxidase family protein [Verrucomicrobiaceae bacterium]